MNYNILGVHIQKLSDATNDTFETYKVFVAWQSNLPGLPFLWRCTSDVYPCFPKNKETFEIVARKAEDEPDQKLVKKLFPYLDGKALWK